MGFKERDSCWGRGAGSGRSHSEIVLIYFKIRPTNAVLSRKKIQVPGVLLGCLQKLFGVYPPPVWQLNAKFVLLNINIAFVIVIIII